MNEKNEQIARVSYIQVAEFTSQERQQLLKTYTEEVLIGTVIFVALLRSAVTAAFICGGMVKFEIQTTILGWLISTVGIICGLSLVARNNYEFFIKPRINGSSKGASSLRIHEEGRTI